jgi:hypothetical protein
MLNEITYTPDLNAEAAILPLLPAHLRRQVLVERARLLLAIRNVDSDLLGDGGAVLEKPPAASLNIKLWRGRQSQ